jgi:hypothetical protein
MGRGVVAVGDASLLGLVLRPFAQGHNLGAQGRLGRGLRRASQSVDQIARGNQSSLILSRAFSQSQHARVVGATLEDRMSRSLAGDRLDRIEGRWNVIGG